MAPPKRVEKGVKINIGAAKEKVEADTGASTGGRIAEIIYDSSDNPYLYDVSGPRKQKNYGKIDNEDMIGAGDEQGFQADFEGEEYKISHKNEKFAIGGLGSKAAQTSTLENDTESAIKAS